MLKDAALVYLKIGGILCPIAVPDCLNYKIGFEKTTMTSILMFSLMIGLTVDKEHILVIATWKKRWQMICKTDVVETDWRQKHNDCFMVWSTFCSLLP